MNKKITLALTVLTVLLIGLVLSALTPLNLPFKGNITGAINSLKYGKDIKNFSSNAFAESNTTVLKNFKDCGYNVKVSNKYKDNPLPMNEGATNPNEVLTLKKTDKKEEDNPDIQIMCLKMNDIIAKFKENVLTAWKDKPELDAQFGTTMEAASKLSVRDFYKLYTQKVTSACKTETDYTSITFLNNDVISSLLKEYNHCTYDFPTLNLVKHEFYFFPTDETKPIIFVRTVDHDNIKKDFLVIKN
jgi:hypothetical protein